jgi:hypothetical protein
MKHTLLYVLAGCLLIGTAGCSRQEKDLFDQSAADRLHATQKAVSDNLTSAGNGWEMRYFPSPDMPGYALLARFSNNGTVTIAAKNSVSSKNTYKEETSMWKMDGTQGCVLSFDTYNTLFSIFADPLSDGVGYAGDYEFVVLKNETNSLSLKGKKHGAYITFNRLSDKQDWMEYFDAIDELNAETFTGNDGIKMTYWDGAKAISVVYDDGTFTYQKDNEDILRSFLVTPSGIHFYTGLPLANSTSNAKDFVLSEDKQVLKTADGNAFIASNFTAVDFFKYRFTNYSRWLYEEEGTDARTRERIDSISKAVSTMGAEISDYAYECYTSTSQLGGRVYNYALRINYTVEGKLFSGRINFNSNITDDVITFSYKSYDESLNPLFMRMNGDQEAGDGGAKKICDIFCDTFTPESYTGSALNMTQLKMNGKNNGSCIHIKAERIIM